MISDMTIDIMYYLLICITYIYVLTLTYLPRFSSVSALYFHRGLYVPLRVYLKHKSVRDGHTMEHAANSKKLLLKNARKNKL